MSEKRVVSDPDIMMGKPVIKGTRITVEQILEKLGAGESIEQVLEEYPRLSREDIQEALTFGAQVLHSEKLYPLEETG